MGGRGATPNPCTTGTSETEELQHPTLSSFQPRHFQRIELFLSLVRLVKTPKMLIVLFGRK